MITTAIQAVLLMKGVPHRDIFAYTSTVLTAENALLGIIPIDQIASFRFTNNTILASDMISHISDTVNLAGGGKVCIYTVRESPVKRALIIESGLSLPDFAIRIFYSKESYTKFCNRGVVHLIKQIDIDDYSFYVYTTEGSKIERYAVFNPLGANLSFENLEMKFNSISQQNTTHVFMA